MESDFKRECQNYGCDESIGWRANKKFCCNTCKGQYNRRLQKKKTEPYMPQINVFVANCEALETVYSKIGSLHFSELELSAYGIVVGGLMEMKKDKDTGENCYKYGMYTLVSDTNDKTYSIELNEKL